MRALVLVAAVLVAGCQGFGAPGEPPPPDALTLAWLPTQSLDPTAAYSTGEAFSCEIGGFVSLHAEMSAGAKPSAVGLAIAKLDSNGNETALGSPMPLTPAGSEPAPTGLNVFIYGPLAVSELCATLVAGDYHARIVSADGRAVLAFGRFTLTP
jgi:hypothetical protein